MRDEPVGDFEPVELTLAHKGVDLWAVVEAAQYARTVTFDDPENENETAAMTRFVQAFSDSAEGWDEVPMPAKAAALDGLARHLSDLRRVGLFVHCGTIERDFTVDGHTRRALPVAVVNLGRTPSSPLTVMLPASMDVTS